MKYLLSRRIKGESEWKTSTKGSLDYILVVLKANLKSPELINREWKVEPLN